MKTQQISQSQINVSRALPRRGWWVAPGLLLVVVLGIYGTSQTIQANKGGVTAAEQRDPAAQAVMNFLRILGDIPEHGQPLGTAATGAPATLHVHSAFLEQGPSPDAAAQGVAGYLSAHTGSEDNLVKVTFAEWINDWPDMEGIVGGDVGNGTFSGKMLDYVPGPLITQIEALYHLNGGTRHSTVHVFVTQYNVKGIAIIEGVVTEGWLVNSQVYGHYDVLSCPDTSLGLCFQGALYMQ